MASDLVDQPLTDAQFREKADAVFSAVEASIDEWLQEDVIDIDTHRAGSMLELVFPNASRVIINTQPPLHELWLAARSGGFHYRHLNGAWRDTRDGTEFFASLSRAASEQAGRTLVFKPD